MKYSPQITAADFNDYQFSTDQLTLFPLDPWGSEHVFEVFDHPCAGIARAMIGPIPMGSDAKGLEINIRCLAVTDDLEYVALLEVYSVRLDDPQSIWSEVLCKLKFARSQPIETCSELPLTPQDCVKSWLAVPNWSRHLGQSNPLNSSLRTLANLFEIQVVDSELTGSNQLREALALRAQAAIAQQVSKGVTFVLTALRSELLEIFHHRKRLSVSMACKLLEVSKSHGEVAVKYALQALRMESFGVIALITTGQPPNESKQVRDAIFSGRSLPEAFESVGVPKSSYRKSICKALGPYVLQPEDAVNLSDLAMSGQEWLLTMRLSKFHPPHTMAQWHEFGKFVQRLCSLQLQNLDMLPAILQWCVKSQYQPSSEKLNFLFQHAKSLQAIAMWLDSYDVSLEIALQYSLGLLHDSNDWRPLSYCSQYQVDLKDASALVTVISEITGKSLNDLMCKFMNPHPGVPDSFTRANPSVVNPLNTLELVLNHGQVNGNCLSSFTILMDYLSSGVDLYEVCSAKGVIGTIALMVESSDEPPKVYVSEIQEINGHPAGFELSHIAQLLADACSAEHELTKWIDYDSQCDSWRQCFGETC